ncbi:MAG TPA: hypothetical protein VJ732_20700 [Bryobacteraceae bacterium]|nr:hypothetical protein [Bryobacteraceae bacterium]
MGKKLSIAAVTAAVLALAGCSQSPPPPAADRTQAEVKKEPPKPAGPVAGETAFYEMYKPARAWATDALPLSLSSDEVPGTNSEEGKYAKWTGIFVSPSHNEARVFTYSITDGVSAADSQSWSGATTNSAPFQITELAVDSDAAYKTAGEKAAGWLKTHPGKKATMTLANASRFPAPVWYVMWGTKSNGYGVFVNAMTGTVVKGK